MEKEKFWWNAAGGWEEMTNAEKRKIFRWLEEYLGKDFAVQLGVARNIKNRLSSYRNYANRINCCDMQELVEILACYDPIRIHAFYVVKSDYSRRAYIGMDGAKYPTKEASDWADEKMIPILRELTGDDSGWKKLRKKRDEEEKNQPSTEYRINFMTEEGEQTMIAVDSLEEAIEKVKNYTGMRLMGTIEMSLDEACNADSLDWTKKNIIEIPKAKLIRSRLENEFSILYKTVKDSPFAEKILNTAQNNDFIEFLKTV